MPIRSSYLETSSSSQNNDDDDDDTASVAARVMVVTKPSVPRWNGNYKHSSKKFKDITKSKTMTLKLTANGITKTFQKNRMESLQHVLTKAILWKVFMEEYPNMEIEKNVNDPNNYRPDVICWNDVDDDHNDDAVVYRNNKHHGPLFWGESGRMKPHKALDLMQRYPYTHIVHCRWDMPIHKFLTPLLDYIENEIAMGRLEHPHTWFHGKFTFGSIPLLLDMSKFFDEETNQVLVTKKDIEWMDLDVSVL